MDAGTVTHQLHKLDMGCHSDSGYSHQPRNLYSQMIYGSSFESPYPVGRRGRPRLARRLLVSELISVDRHHQ